MLNEWREQLTDFERTILQKTYDQWKNTAKWPKSLSLAIELRTQGDLYKAARGIGYEFIHTGEPYRKSDECRLTVMGLAMLGSEKELGIFIKVLQYSVKKFIENPELAKVISDEIKQKFSLSDLETLKICDLFHEEAGIWSGASKGKDGKQSFDLSYNILKFEDIKSIEDYINISEKGQIPSRFGGIKGKDILDYEYQYKEEIEPYSPINLDFISDPNIRSLVESDLEELHYALRIGAWKSATILSAIIAEAILLDLFTNNEQIARRTLKGKWPNKASLYDMTLAASHAGLISEPAEAVFGVLRIYRNQIHPNRAKHEKRPDESVANALYALVQMLLKDANEKLSSQNNEKK